MIASYNRGIIFTIFVLIIFIYGAFGTMAFSKAGRLFPLVITCCGIILACIQLLVDLKNRQKSLRGENDTDQDFVDIAPDADIPAEIVKKRGLRFLGWLLGLYLFIWLVGFKISVPVFIVAYLRNEAKASWWKIGTLTIITGYLVFYHFEKLLGVFWPRPVIADFVKITWLF